MEERIMALEARLDSLMEQIGSIEAQLTREPKNKKTAELGGLEAAMAEARHRLFGRSG